MGEGGGAGEAEGGGGNGDKDGGGDGDGGGGNGGGDANGGGDGGDAASGGADGDALKQDGASDAMQGSLPEKHANVALDGAGRLQLEPDTTHRLVSEANAALGMPSAIMPTPSHAQLGADR